MPLQRRRITLAWQDLAEMEPALGMLETTARELSGINRADIFCDDDDFDDDDFDEDDFDEDDFGDWYEPVPDEFTFDRHVNSILVNFAGPAATKPALQTAAAYDLARAHLWQVYVYGSCDLPECRHVMDGQPGGHEGDGEL